MTDRYIGRDDPAEAARLEAQRVGAVEELRVGLAFCELPGAPRVLEIGAGTGVLTSALVEALPGARITAVDVNNTLLAAAHARMGPLADAGGPVRLEHADAAALPYPDRSFDLTACRCVLMHQLDPMVVAGELHRVTAPGGSVLLIEPDWGARAVYPDSEAYDELLALARRARPYGFPDLFVGRKLFAILRAAGFVPVHLQTRAFVTSADDIDPGARGMSKGPWQLLEQARGMLRSHGLVDDAALDALIGRLRSQRSSQDYCSIGVDLVAVGRKPVPKAALSSPED